MPNNKLIDQKFTTNLKKGLNKAYNFAWQNGHGFINPEHLLLGLLSMEGSISKEILTKAGLTVEFLKDHITKTNKSLSSPEKPSSFITIPAPSKTTKKILKKAVLIAYSHQHPYVGTEHLLSAICKEGKALLKAKTISNQRQLQAIINQSDTVIKSTSKFPDIIETFNIGQDALRDHEESDYRNCPMSSFGKELTSVHAQKNIDPTIAREKETERITEILLRRTKNNPLLVGEPGVGKTAIVEGLAKKISEGNIPPVLMNKKIYSLDLSAIISGTIYRGEFEARLKQIIEEAQKDPNIILFIDEIHMLIGTGAGSGSMDAANILKPALSKGDIRCIGATTYTEYKRHIETDPALERRFQMVRIKEPNEKQVLEILHGIKNNYQLFHKVIISDEALNAALTYSKKYLPKKFFPDKAIDLIDEAASKFQLKRKLTKSQKIVIDKENELKKINKALEKSITEETFDDALILRGNQLTIEEKLDNLYLKIDKEQNILKDKITENEIAEVVSNLSGIPQEKIQETEMNSVLKFEDNLNKEIIGQRNAINLITSTIKRNAVGLNNENKPAGSFLFAGPTGAGKTLTAQKIAEHVFGNKEAIIKLDMSEYSEKFNLSKLIGAPAGYVGFQDSGILSNRILQNPYSVILFDEIEKAHPDVLNILLQILDEGILTDASGKKINFQNNIIILTTNIGNEFAGNKGIVGFSDKSGKDGEYKILEENINNSLKNHLKPELLNRIEQKIVFRQLEEEDLRKITVQKLELLNKKLESKKITIKLSPKSLQYIASYKTKPSEGARNIERNIQELLETPLADHILKQKIKKNDKITVSIKNKNLDFQQK